MTIVHSTKMKKYSSWSIVYGLFLWFMVYRLWTMDCASAEGKLPSLFRSVVVADSPLGVRVVSVEDGSQASLADLRPEDVIVQINDTVLHSIDEFATLSAALRGRAMQARVLAVRRGQSRQLSVHLYSYPVLRTWGLTFAPEYDFRFADPKVGVAYWTRMGRGFETARQSEAALNAYLNALHNEPTNVEAAVKAAQLLWEVARQHLEAKRLPQGVAALQQGAAFLERLFEYPLDAPTLQLLKHQLNETVQLLHAQIVSKP